MSLSRFRCANCGILWLSTREFVTYTGKCPRKGCGGILKMLSIHEVTPDVPPVDDTPDVLVDEMHKLKSLLTATNPFQY